MTRSFAFSLLLLVASAGCGDDGNSADAAMLVHDMSAPDLGPPPSTITDAGSCLSSMPAGLMRYGVIELSSFTGSDADPTQRSFGYAAVGSGSPLTVYPATVAGCALAPSTPVAPPAGPVRDYRESAGSLTVGGGTRTVELALLPDASGYTFMDGSLVWPGSAALAIDVGGGCDTPATHFDTFMPKSVQLSGPKSGDTVSRSADLVVSWTPGSGTFSYSLSAHTGTIVCNWDAASGSGTVDKSLLAQLIGASAEVSAGVTNFIDVTRDGRQWHISIGTSALAADGTTFKATLVDLQ
jgi:hypothetical protein